MGASNYNVNMPLSDFKHSDGVISFLVHQLMLLITSRGILPWVALKSQLMRKLRDFTVTMYMHWICFRPVNNYNCTIPLPLVMCNSIHVS